MIKSVMTYAFLAASMIGSFAYAQQVDSLITPVISRESEFAVMKLPDALRDVPKLNCPLYVMEYHIWYTSPFGIDDRKGYDHGGPWELADTQSAGPDWMRDRKSVGYPLVGTYNSEDKNIIRWQVQCMKAAGIDGAIVQLFPRLTQGEFTGDTFFWDHAYSELFKIAEEEGVKIGVQDEVGIRRKQTVHESKDRMIQRVGGFLKKYAKSSAYLRIDGKPVYTFYHNRVSSALSVNELDQMLKAIEKEAGESVYWILYAPTENLASVDSIGGLIPFSNAENQFLSVVDDIALLGEKGRFPKVPGFVDTPLKTPLSPAIQNRFQELKAKYSGKSWGLWGYVGFEDSGRNPSRKFINWLPRHGGKTIVDILKYYQDMKPDFIVLTSWNDWEENTALEPGINYDGYAGDPYLYCRILAAAKGKTFVPPPLPPKESVDPWLWQTLYGIDRTPPRVTRWRYAPLEPALTVSVSDSGNPVRQSVLYTQSDASIEFVDGMKSHRIKPSKAFNTAEPILSAEKNAGFIVDFEALKGNEQELFIALEIEDLSKGGIQVTYSANPVLVDYKPTDERRRLVGPVISCVGDGARRSFVRLMRGADFSASPFTLNLRFNPRGNTKASEGIRILRLHLLGRNGVTVAGREISFAAPQNQNKIFRFVTPDLMGNLPRTAYVRVEDAAGNWSVPFPISPRKNLLSWPEF